MIGDREQFLSVIFSGPLLKSDAVVVLCGQDGIERAKVGVQMMRQESAPYLVLSGGVDVDNQLEGAKTCHPFVMGQGVSPSRIILETGSTNTREQAVAVISMAVEKKWRRLLLTASPYHIPRVFLTFLKALQEVDKDEEVQLVAVPASHLPWWKSPKGEKRTRLELLSGEAGKIAMYPEHIASYASGLEHLRLWESR